MTYVNNISGSVTINGGTIDATGGYGAAGIGGGSNGTLNSITITGGEVMTTGGYKAAAIGLGFNSFTNGSGTLTCPAIIITSGIVTANGNIGYGMTTYGAVNQDVGGSVTIDDVDITLTLQNNGEFSAETVNTDNWKQSVIFEANGGTGTMETQTVKHGVSYTLPECAFTPPNGKYFVKWTINDKSYAPGNSVTVNSKITVKAQWEDYAVITFDPSEGSGEMQSVYVKKETFYILPFILSPNVLLLLLMGNSFHIGQTPTVEFFIPVFLFVYHYSSLQA